MEGRTPLKTKKMDVILHVAAALHIFNHVTSDLLTHREPTLAADAIEKSNLLRAINYVVWAESQKEIFVEVTIFYCFYLNSPDCLRHCTQDKSWFQGLTREKKLNATIEKETSFVCSVKTPMLPNYSV